MKIKKKTDAVELRRQAEAKLSKRKKSSITEIDSLRLIHELEVHQIELEMQNEELIQAHAEAETLQRQYTHLYDFAPVGYFTLTLNGTIERVNLTGADLLGVEHDKLVKRRFGIFVTAQSRTTFSTFLEKVFISKCKESCEISLLKDGSAPLWVRVEAIFDAADGGCEHEACQAVVSDITERVQAEEALRHLSTHDELTGLYNRGFFMAEMERLERGRQFPVSIVMADVDGLKKINDQEGHAAGDAVLSRVAQALTAAFRTEDVVARIGGDEFAVLLPATDAATAKVLLGRAHHVIQEDNTAHAETPIQLSIGVCTADSSIPLSVTLKKADVNMYREKRGGDIS